MSTFAHAKVIPIVSGGSDGEQRATGNFDHSIGLNKDTLEHRKLIDRIAQVERDERCLRRVILLTAGLTALAAAGLAYGLILQEDFGHGESSFVARLIGELGLASLISLLGITGLWLVYRNELNGLMRDCHRLIVQLLECRQELSLGNRVAEDDTIKETGAAILDTINRTSNAAIRDAAALGGDLKATANGLVKGAIESGKKLGLNAEEAAVAAANGALAGAGQVGSTAVESVRTAVTKPVNEIKAELKKSERAPP